MSADRPAPRRIGNDLIVGQAQRQVQTFFDELKNGTQNYRTIASLGEQIAQAYRGRCILELLQNAHDALAKAAPDDPRQISFVLSTSPEPVLLIGNSGCPFHIKDFKGVCQLGQSPKDPNENVGNKGLGFRSVLEVSTCPEIWSTAPAGSETSFVFRFDPSVIDQVAEAAQEIEERGLDARSPFDPGRPLVDWSPEQLERYRGRLADTGLGGANEARKFMSPYLIPLPIEGVLSDVEKLLSAGHVTVVRLPLDGGRTGTGEEAVQSVKAQLQELDARATVFLSHLETLVIEINGERHTLERVVDSDVEFSDCPRTRQQRLLVHEHSGPAAEDDTTRQFQVWTRTLGGDEDPVQAERIRSVVEHLPNRWPEVREVAVGVAVQEAPEPDEGIFVIFLPTEIKTGTGAHVNAPFYGSLDRRQIDFTHPYNGLLLEHVLDLCLDAVTGLTAGPPEDRRARAVVDILSSTAPVGDWCFMNKLLDRASERGSTLDTQALILSDDDWCIPSKIRLMPTLSGDNPISVDQWRGHAEFAVVSTVLDGRRSAVQALIQKIGGSIEPTNHEWLRTIEKIARSIQVRKIDVTWDAFLNSVVAVLPDSLRSEPRAGARDPLADARFLPAQDGRLLCASGTAKLFFQPVRGADDAADFVGEVPSTLKQHIAFLHPDVRTHEQDGPRRNTPLQKFLEGRFARGFRREEILREVVVAALPPLPARHGSPEADRCLEIFTWTLKLLDKDEPETLLPLLERLPVACHGGWFAMNNAAFGPGWPNRLGGLVWSLADELSEDIAARLRKTALLPPDDPRWGGVVGERDELFSRVGVVDGLRLQNAREISFYMDGDSHELPTKSPLDTPQAAWDAWREAVHKEVNPDYVSRFKYSLTEIKLLPEIHYLTNLSKSGRKNLSRLVLTLLESWPASWKSARIKKLEGGYSWSRDIMSPLKYWLTTLPWFVDGSVVDRPLSDRWLVSTVLLRGQRDRFQHLNPLSMELARRLETVPELKVVLNQLGLNIYPVEDDRTGPELLEALAVAWDANRIPSGRFDMFLGQVRDAWRHLDMDRGLPERFLARTGRRMFSVLKRGGLADVYLPDHGDRTRSLREHGKHILEMHSSDASRMVQAFLDKTNIRQASTLEERFLIDGMRWMGMIDGVQPLDQTRYASWLPTTLLTVAAHGGEHPAGATTKAWREAVERLRRAHVLECEDITVQLVDDHVVASSEPTAQWLPDEVLAIRREKALDYESFAPAAQAMLDRQNLLKDLRLVLGALTGYESPTQEQVEAAMERAEIDASAFADVRDRWAGNISLLVDRIRPVLALFEIPDGGLGESATEIGHLTEWLSSNLQQWPAHEILSAARRSRDDHAMGMAAWRVLGDVARLPAWNAALAKLGDRYAPVENRDVGEQTATQIEAVTPLLRGFSRHVAIETGKPDLFHQIEEVSKSIKGADEWSTQWWEVPFGAVIDALRVGYAGVPGIVSHLDVFEGVRTVGDLRTAFQARGMESESDPYEIYSINRNKLSEIFFQVHDFYRAWKGSQAPDRIPSEPPTNLDPTAYLRLWSDPELLDRTLCIIGDATFINACDGCASLEDVRERLELDPRIIQERRRERLQGRREAERRQRTFDVAGFSFEIGASSYSDLLEHLNDLTVPEGPRVNRDELTPLDEAHQGSRPPVRDPAEKGKISSNRPSPELRDLVGVVGEIQAYRFLRAQFGKDIVTRDAWVSETRLKILPPVTGEPENTSDAHGFDFQFRYHGKKWHIEAKATMGDDPQFELGISEIEAANRLARTRGGRWRILRIRNALSNRPEFDWLPNPFEGDFRKHFRLHRGGMMMSYARKKP